MLAFVLNVRALAQGSYASCGGGLQAECVWSYGPSENNLWEGIGKEVALDKGTATITLELDGEGGEVRKMSSWPRTLANFSLF